ncbi:jerky protein homolog [Hylaeus anthracinus]|uniref:jerky protein homolog n=1 Tax=Hylaeus anthracinus TaxID=313031 RepID=UPI0023B888ED|nr:jerky protein homolog [Hylaeus anthracinus]XP_054007740.1 jerky protein homolog [Hylaeus anthracinus]XP_054007741.1 jerky protein homolog [Hylaeus anthracinus]
MLPGQKKTRVCLSLQQRADILRQLEDGVSMSQLMKDYGISDATVRRIKSHAVQIRRQSHTRRFKDKKRFGKPILGDVDTRLYEWYQEQQAADDYVSNTMLKQKAIELNKEFGGPSSFTASQGWLWRFKIRHGIGCYEFTDDVADVDTRVTENITYCFLQRLKDEGIELQNVYSMDEMGLAWKALPRKILTDPLARRVYGKRTNKNRVTVGLCSNAIGTHKLPPLFIHRCHTPIALKHCMNYLPVVFKAAKNAWIDQNVFADWLESHFKPAVKKHQFDTGSQGKVLLLLDKCRAHTLPPQTLMEDDNVKVAYLPKVSSSMHPMQQGIVKSVKVSYRLRVLRRILNFPGGVAPFYADYDVKDCIDLVNESWTDVTQADICNSWKKLVGSGPTLKEKSGVGQNKEHLCDRSDITAIKDTIKTIVNEAVSDKDAEKWLSLCEKVERDPDDVQLEEEEFLDERTTLHRDEDEIDRTIAKLTLWSERQSDIIKLHARLLKDYFDLVQR